MLQVTTNPVSDNSRDRTLDYDVIVVGAGLAGASAAYHLMSRTEARILLLEAGKLGWGRHEAMHVDAAAPVLREGDEKEYKPWISGTAGPGAVKMVVTSFAASLDEYVRHHGVEGARTYLEAAGRGGDILRKMCHEFLPEKHRQDYIRETGSLCVTTEDNVESLEAAFHMFKKLGCNVEMYSKEQVQALHGSASEFVRGIFFPKDFIIHSPMFVKHILEQCDAKSERLCVREHARVTKVDDQHGFAVVTLASGERLYSRFVVLATGGLFADPELWGILRPTWSYYAYLPASWPPTKDGKPDGIPFPNSPNYFTFGFSHDWCVTDGELRISGEDHLSALKPPREAERCKRLAEWAYRKYPYLDRNKRMRMHYGVCSDTGDYTPIVGRRSPTSSVAYLCGCNAWGQAILSAGASLIPGALGYVEHDAWEKKVAAFMSPERFTGRLFSKL